MESQNWKDHVVFCVNLAKYSTALRFLKSNFNSSLEEDRNLAIEVIHNLCDASETFKALEVLTLLDKESFEEKYDHLYIRIMNEELRRSTDGACTSLISEGTSFLEFIKYDFWKKKEIELFGSKKSEDIFVCYYHEGTDNLYVLKASDLSEVNRVNFFHMIPHLTLMINELSKTNMIKSAFHKNTVLKTGNILARKFISNGEEKNEWLYY